MVSPILILDRKVHASSWFKDAIDHKLGGRENYSTRQIAGILLSRNCSTDWLYNQVYFNTYWLALVRMHVHVLGSMHVCHSLCHIWLTTVMCAADN